MVLLSFCRSGKRRQEIDRTRRARKELPIKERPPATGMVVGGPTAMSKAVEPTGVVDTGTGMTGIAGELGGNWGCRSDKVNFD